MLGLNFLLFGHNPDIEFVTSLSIDECKKRLTQEIHRKRPIFSFRYPPPPIVEYLIGNYFLVSRNQSFFYRDNLLVLGGQLQATHDGTLVRAAFRLYEGISIILTLGFCVFFGLALNGIISNGVEIGVLLIPIVFFGFFGLILGLLLHFRKSQRNGLVTYLKSVLPPSAKSRA
jgi:hypothetical protein